MSVRYHLRVTLTPEHFESERQAMWRVIEKGRIDEAVFFVPHAEERSPGLGTDEENRHMVELLRPVFAELKQKGVAGSINMWWTLSFSDFPGAERGPRPGFDFRPAVSASGQSRAAVACPRDPAWRAQVTQMYATYAELQPRVIWVDDDVRLTLRAGLRSACFCDDCVGEVAQRTGNQWTRQELVAAIAADPPNAVRDAWLDFQEQIMRELLRSLAEAVRRVSPQTIVGSMISQPEGHSTEGRKWGPYIAALGQATTYVRPTLGCYTDDTVRNIAEGLYGPLRTHAVTPPSVVLAPEIENYPQSRFFKSRRLVQCQMTMTQLMGLREITLSIYRFAGRLDLESDDAWERMLADLKPRLQAIADLDIRTEQLQGVGLIIREQISRYARGVDANQLSSTWTRRRPWDIALSMLGVATTFGDAGVTVISGEQARCLSEQELARLLSRGVVIDARAAAELIEMGHGELVGVQRRLASVESVTEQVDDAAFGAAAGDRINLRWEGQAWQFEPAPGSKAISSIRHYDGSRTGHGVLLFENRLGGRVALYPFDPQINDSINTAGFISGPRQAQLMAVLEWLARGPLPLSVPGAPSIFPLLARQGKRSIVGVGNLQYDKIPALRLELADPPHAVNRVRALDARGQWQPLPVELERRAGRLVVQTHLAVDCLEVAVLSLET